jgi:hypothetical protein
MNVTSLQQHNLHNYEKEIALLEQQVKTKGVWYALQLSWIFVIGLYITGYFFDALIESKPLMQYLAENSWLRILFSWFFWFIIDYFWLVKGFSRELKKKKEAYESYKIKLGVYA